MDKEILNKFREEFGWNFSMDENMVAGLSWDNSFNFIGEKIKEYDATEIEVEKNEIDRYCIKLFKDREMVYETRWNKEKSFTTPLMELIMFDKEFYNRFSKIHRSEIVGNFLGKHKIANDTINQIKEFNDGNTEYFTNNIDVSMQDFSWDYGKRINLMFYKFLFSKNKVKQNLYLDKKGNTKNNKFQKLENLLRAKFSGILSSEVRKIDFGNIEKSSSMEDVLKQKTTVSIEINQILEAVQRGVISIPVFQRDYVWGEKKIVALLNTISKGFPMGSILIAQSEIMFDTKNEVLMALKESKSTKEERFIVMDGQQRLTSILLTFAFATISDVESINVNMTLNAMLLKIENICFYDGKFYLKKDLIKDKKVTKENVSIYLIKNNRVNLLEKFGKYKLSAIYISDLKFEDLLDIFKNINISSTNLTEIDLLHSAFYGQNDKSDLLKTLSEIKKLDKVKKFDIPKTWLVQAAKIMTDIKILDSKKSDDEVLKIDISNKSIFKLSGKKETTNIFLKELNSLEKYLNKTLKVLNKELGMHNSGGTPNMSFFFSTLLIVKKYAEEDLNYKDWDYKVDRFFYNHWKKYIRNNIIRSLTGDYSAGTSSKVKADLNSIYKDLEPIQKEFSLQTSFENSTYKNKDSLYKIIMGELSLKGPLSLVDGVSKVVSLDEAWANINKDQHHFLPSKVKGYKDLREMVINRVNNIFLISSEENRKDIKNSDPFDYLFKNAPDNFDLEKHAKSHFIDPNIWKEVHKKVKAKEAGKYLSENEKRLLIEKVWESRKNNIIEHLENKWNL